MCPIREICTSLADQFFPVLVEIDPDRLVDLARRRRVELQCSSLVLCFDGIACQSLGFGDHSTSGEPLKLRRDRAYSRRSLSHFLSPCAWWLGLEPAGEWIHSQAR